MDLTNLKEQVCSCKKCMLSESRTNVVFGEGKINADVMFIGEAPGKNEDIEARPFVGRSGKYLDELLKKIGLSRHDVFIANVVKCRPPGNRDPKAQEILKCAPYLRMQTKLINPKIIVTLGNFATRFILKTEKGITLLHGKQVKIGKFIVLPLYHPAATIYDSKKKAALEKDFTLIAELLSD